MHQTTPPQQDKVNSPCYSSLSPHIPVTSLHTSIPFTSLMIQLYIHTVFNTRHEPAAHPGRRRTTRARTLHLDTTLGWTQPQHQHASHTCITYMHHIHHHFPSIHFFVSSTFKVFIKGTIAQGPSRRRLHLLLWVVVSLVLICSSRIVV